MKRSVLRLLRITAVFTGSLLVLFFILSLLFPLRDQISYSTVVLDNRGEIIHAFLTPDQQWRLKTTLPEISPLLRKTIVAKEDRYFYFHPGVNLLALFQALAHDIFHPHQLTGASTITMQVAKALYPGRRTIGQKGIEIFRAFQLEIKYSKDEILQLYLNLVPYGGNIQGVKSAAFLYFQKNPDHLSLAEITALSIIPNRPASRVIGRHNARIEAVRNGWLRRFAKEKVFTEKEIEDALHEPLTAFRHPMPALMPQFSISLQKQAAGGLLHTGIDLNKQRPIEKLVMDYGRSLRLMNIQQAAVVVLDNTTHQVVAYVGSADFKDTTDAGQVNGAAAIREPGSTLKPLLYALCIDQGLLTPKTVLHDVPVNYAGYTPENYDRKFNGYVSMEYALEHSLNIPAVKSLELLGKDRLVQSLALCNCRQIKKDQQKLGLSLILGGCGTSLEELTGMYSAFAAGGIFFPPRFVSSSDPLHGSTVFSASAAFMINEILSKVNRPDFPLSWQSTAHLPKIAWKTGTSYGKRDAWSIGYNKHFTVGVWCGNFSARGVPELSGANIATPLLFKIFNTIDYDADESWFDKPEDCHTRTVCARTGQLPGDDCDQLISDYFIPGISSGLRCSHRQEVLVSADGRLSYCRYCAPTSGYIKKTFDLVTPDMKRYFEEHGIAYQHIPPHNPACEKIFKEGAPVLLSPRPGNEYLISRKKPEPLQLRCNTGNDVSRVYWYINDKFYKASEAKARQFFIPEEGPVKISCTDDKGRNCNSWIRVRYVDL